MQCEAAPTAEKACIDNLPKRGTRTSQTKAELSFSSCNIVLRKCVNLGTQFVSSRQKAGYELPYEY